MLVHITTAHKSKLRGSAYCKQASLDAGGAEEWFAVVPSQRLVKDSATFRTISLFNVTLHVSVQRYLADVAAAAAFSFSSRGPLSLEKGTFFEEFLLYFSSDHMGQCAI